MLNKYEGCYLDDRSTLGRNVSAFQIKDMVESVFVGRRRRKVQDVK